MKKIFLLAIAAFMFTTGMQAQIVRSQSTSIQREKTPSNTRWYMRLGLGLSKFVGEDVKDADLSAKPSYDFMFGFQKPIAQSSAYWGMELGFGQRGYKQSIEEKYDGAKLALDQTFKTHNIKVVPFQFGYRAEIGSTNFAVDPHLGVFVSYDFAGKKTIDKFTIDGEDVTDELDSDLKETSLSDMDNYPGVDVGIQFGVGFWWKNVNLDFTYQRGFIPVWDYDDCKVFSSQFMIRLGFSF